MTSRSHHFGVTIIISVCRRTLPASPSRYGVEQGLLTTANCIHMLQTTDKLSHMDGFGAETAPSLLLLLFNVRLLWTHQCNRRATSWSLKLGYLSRDPETRWTVCSTLPAKSQLSHKKFGTVLKLSAVFCSTRFSRSKGHIVQKRSLHGTYWHSFHDTGKRNTVM